MERGAWDPICHRPENLVWPLTAGRAGGDLTWKVANGRRYEKVAKGLYLPVDRGDSVEQRIIEAAARLPADGSRGCVTAWGALRWRGAAYFDGLDARGVERLPVQLVVPPHTNLNDLDGVEVRRRLIGPLEVEVVDGLPVATPARALFDEILRRDDLWAAVQAIDMTAAARLISVWLFGQFLGFCNSRNGAPLAREAASFGVDESRSPREPWFRLVWRLLALLDEPLVNEPVYDLSGRLIGIPDLFDPVTGLAGEYSGEIHLGRKRRQRDVARAEDFRDHGIEIVEVVGGDSREVAAARLRAGHRRALARAGKPRSWTVERPAWDRAPETLDAFLERTGQVERLTACDSAPRDSSSPGRPETALTGRPDDEVPRSA